MEEGIFIVPLHLVSNAWIGSVISFSEDVDLMVSHPVDRSTINNLLDRYVVLHPSTLRQPIIMARSMTSTRTTTSLNILSVIDVEIL